MGFLAPRIGRHGLFGLYLTILLASIGVVLGATGAGIVFVFVVNAVVKDIATRDQLICILHDALRIVPGFIVLFILSGCGVLLSGCSVLLSGCGVFLSLFFTGVVGSLFGIIDLFLAAPILGIWRVIPQRWEYRRDQLFDIGAVYVFFIHAMATSLWPIHLFRLMGIPSWTRTFEALATSFNRNYSELAIFTIPVIPDIVFESRFGRVEFREIYRALAIGGTVLQALYFGRVFSLFRTAASDLFTENKATLSKQALLHIGPMRMGAVVVGDSLGEEYKNKLDAALLSLAVPGLSFSRFRYLALVQFDDGISRLRGWGYDGWALWLLSYGVHAWVVFTDRECYLLLARMATRLIGAMVQEVEFVLCSAMAWLLLREEEGASLPGPLLTRQAQWVRRWCRAVDSSLG